MVATPKKIGSGSGAVKYFYFTEKNYECDKGWLSTKGCEVLELRELTKENFANILDGKIIDPTINKPSHDKSTDAKVEGNIIQLGRKTKEGIEHQAGQEIIFSAPKSVSIMHLVAKDARIEDAHKRAVESIVGYVERHMIYSRVQKDGVMHLEKTGNIAAAQYTHLTSRPPKSEELKEGEKNDASIKSNQIMPDPQLHSHVILANATKCKDGKWRSIVFEKIYEYQMFLGESYRMELAREIEKLGYTVKIFKDKKSNRWTFEIDGKGYDLSADIKKMSQRRQDIKDMSESEGRSDGKSMAHYAKITRDEKIEHSKERLEREWEKKVKDISALKDLVAEAKLKLENAKNDHQNNEMGLKQKIDYVMSYAEGLLSEYEAVWEYTKLMEGAIEKSANNFSIERLELEINKRSKSGQFIKPYNKNLDTLTTVGNLLAEKKCLMKLRELIGKDKPIMNQTEIRDNLRGRKLNLGQRDAVKLVLGTRDRVIGIQGSAGTGKTTTLNVIKELSENKGYELLGLAPTKSAATIMREVVNINAMTVHLFCGKYAGVIAGRGTEEGKKKMMKEFSNKIVVVDESSLIASNKMNDLLILADKLKFKMVLLGDIKQLGAVEAGKPFYYLQDYGMKVAIIQNILRQQDKGLLSTVYETEKAIDKDWIIARRGIESALNKLGKDNIISLKKEDKQVTNKDLASAAYDEWYKFYQQEESCYIVALSNPLKHEVNSLVRKHYINVDESSDYVVLEKKKLAKVQMRESLFYKPVEDLLVFNKDYKEFKNGGYYIITGKEGGHNLRLREYNNPNSHEYKFDLMALESIRDGVIEVFNQTTLKIAKGERIRWTRNSKTHDYIINGDSAIVQDINNKEVIIKTRAGKKKVLSVYSKEWLHIDHDYSGTSYAAQGESEDNVVGIARAKEKYIDLSTQRAFYVTLSRGRKSAKLITDDYDNLSRSMASKSGDKTSGTEHISGKQRDNLEELKKSSREVYIARNTQNRSEIGQIEKTTDRMDFKVINKGYNYHRAYESFVSDRRLIENTAREFFGDVNHKLSRGDNLRFGNKGSVSVNLINGQWYDFKSGEGGSLFKLYNKTGNVLERNLIKRNIQKPVDKDLERANKIKRVEQISRDALVISKNTIAVNNYLKVHRKINLENIRLSTDIKSSNNLWSSESRSNHLGLVAIARDKSGKETAAQMIYLDNKTYNKNKSLDINKRTMGVLKGSFVELTQNSKSNNIFIAEGIETGLSIASSVKDSRVICALGISNMLSIEKYLKDEDKNKSIVVVADNDGNDSITIQIIDKAVVQLSEAGYKNVQLIKPKTIGYDFNDVLKVRGEKGIKVYTDELLKKAPDIKNRLSNLSKRIALST